MTFGRYQVVGRREYRGHETDTVFEARLDRNAEARAIRRGDIVLLEQIQPGLEPGSFVLPDGWLTAEPSTIEAPERRLTR